jgi:AraC-like DNA-binding protein
MHNENELNIYIKYMVSIRCKMLVKSELDKLGMIYESVELGEVLLEGDLSEEQRLQLRAALLRSGLELMDDKEAILVNKIKQVIINKVHYSDKAPPQNIPKLISEELQLNYAYLSNLFSEVSGMTIEKYIIAHKIERIKELLLYDEMSLTAISYLMNYSSLAHLSAQFKKVTGITPSYFKKIKQYKGRIAIDSI